MRRKNLAAVPLTQEQKKYVKEEIAAFYHDVRGTEIGIIEQEQLLELFTETLGPVIYDKALDDVRQWYRRQQENMESDYYLLYKGDVRP